MIARLTFFVLTVVASLNAAALPAHIPRDVTVGDVTTTAMNVKQTFVDLKAQIDVQASLVLAALPNAASDPHAVVKALQPVAVLVAQAKVSVDAQVDVVTVGKAKRACDGQLDQVAYDLLKTAADLINTVDGIAEDLPVLGALVAPVIDSIKGDLSTILGAVRQLLCGVLGLVQGLLGGLGIDLL